MISYYSIIWTKKCMNKVYFCDQAKYVQKCIDLPWVRTLPLVMYWKVYKIAPKMKRPN